MYQGFTSYKNWDFELVNYTNAEYGPYCSVPAQFFYDRKFMSVFFFSVTSCGCFFRWSQVVSITQQLESAVKMSTGI